ncbi:hypothetical protein ACN4EG_10200 [Alkalinema pantanalense CENA528]|uniref:slr1957 family protein n=1 Tax=Alkalinema pantanalense TaxID=1620705 RepID=UPI003D701273
MNHYCEQWIADWCLENGWTDWFRDRSSYWAFPPNAVMPVPIPQQVLRAIKAEKGLSADERFWCLVATTVFLVSLGLSCVLAAPIPLVAGFAFCAIVVGTLEDEAL